MHLDWLINGYHAPFHVAKEKGWYSDGGLDVTINPGKGSFDAVRAVGAGDAEFGFPDAATAVKSIAEGIPLTMVAVFLQETPMGIVSYTDKNITAPKDLEGKTLSNVPIASTAKVLPAFFKQERRRRRQGDTRQPYLRHRGSERSGRPGRRRTGVRLRRVPRDQERRRGPRGSTGSASPTTVSRCTPTVIAVSNDFLASNPDAVDAFVKASIRGLEWTIANPDSAIDILFAHTETEKATLKEQLEAAIPLMNNADAMQNGLGSMTAEKWATTQDIMIEYGEQPSRVPDESAYTTQFLP